MRERGRSITYRKSAITDPEFLEAKCHTTPDWYKKVYD
jgi:hypothetical protein